MLFMVIEKFKNGDARAVYSRALERGRMLPDGLRYVESWVEANLQRCFQLMECDDPRLFQEWVARWQDLVDFEIVPIVPSKQTTETVNSLLHTETESQIPKGNRSS
jgi:fatty-acid desaturase